MLFVQNQQLLTETNRPDLQLDTVESQNIKTKAKANEFLYYKLQEFGLISQMDIDIGIEFIDTDRNIATQGTGNHDSVNSLNDSNIKEDNGNASN